MRKNQKGTKARVIFVSLIAAISSGILFALLVLVLGDGGRVPDFNALFIATLVSLPLSIPLGIVGGLCAAALLRRELSQTRNRWIGLGGVLGLVVGGLGATVYCLLFNGWFFDAALLAFLSIGSISGLLAGAAVGMWCARATSLSRGVVEDP